MPCRGEFDIVRIFMRFGVAPTKRTKVKENKERALTRDRTLLVCRTLRFYRRAGTACTHWCHLRTSMHLCERLSILNLRRCAALVRKLSVSCLCASLFDDSFLELQKGHISTCLSNFIKWTKIKETLPPKMNFHSPLGGNRSVTTWLRLSSLSSRCSCTISSSIFSCSFFSLHNEGSVSV